MTRPQPEALATFQSQRSAQRRNAVLNAIRQLNRAAHPVTVAGVATLAGVDRSYIYDHPDLLDQIRQQRGTTPVKLAPRPVAERSTLASLQARLTSAHEQITRLKAENRNLRDRLAVTLGDAWQADLTDTAADRIRRLDIPRGRKLPLLKLGCFACRYEGWWRPVLAARALEDWLRKQGYE